MYFVLQILISSQQLTHSPGIPLLLQRQLLHQFLRVSVDLLLRNKLILLSSSISWQSFA